jgi:hypothetical protein
MRPSSLIGWSDACESCAREIILVMDTRQRREPTGHQAWTCPACHATHAQHLPGDVIAVTLRAAVELEINWNRSRP